MASSSPVLESLIVKLVKLLLEGSMESGSTVRLGFDLGMVMSRFSRSVCFLGVDFDCDR